MAWLVERSRSTNARRILAATLAIWSLWSAYMVLERNSVWRDNVALFEHDVEVQPRSARIQLHWAHILQGRGEQQRYAYHLERVIELFPDHAEACYDLGVYYLQSQRLDDGIRCLKQGARATRTPRCASTSV